jgi:hypothetical protein
MNTCFRIYSDFSRSATENIPDEYLSDWKTLNSYNRPGCAQVVNGKVIYRGYVNAKRLKDVDPTVTDDLPGVTVDQANTMIRNAHTVSVSKEFLALLDKGVFFNP